MAPVWIGLMDLPRDQGPDVPEGVPFIFCAHDPGDWSLGFCSSTIGCCSGRSITFWEVVATIKWHQPIFINCAFTESFQRVVDMAQNDGPPNMEGLVLKKTTLQLDSHVCPFTVVCCFCRRQNRLSLNILDGYLLVNIQTTMENPPFNVKLHHYPISLAFFYVANCNKLPEGILPTWWIPSKRHPDIGDLHEASISTTSGRRILVVFMAEVGSFYCGLLLRYSNYVYGT